MIDYNLTLEQQETKLVQKQLTKIEMRFDCYRSFLLSPMILFDNMNQMIAQMHQAAAIDPLSHIFAVLCNLNAI